MKPNEAASNSPRLTIWGLTGGIASGKSVVAQSFKDAGVAVVDADQVSRDLLTFDSDTRSEVLQSLGTLDRQELRQKIFANPKARAQLEAILHPRIARMSQNLFSTLRSSIPVGIYEASLLVETGRHRELGGLIVVTSPQASRIDRLMKRDNVSRELAEKMIAAQATDESKIKEATYVFVNNDNLMSLKSQVESWIKNESWRRENWPSRPTSGKI